MRYVVEQMGHLWVVHDTLLDRYTPPMPSKRQAERRARYWEYIHWRRERGDSQQTKEDDPDG